MKSQLGLSLHRSLSRCCCWYSSRPLLYIVWHYLRRAMQDFRKSLDETLLIVAFYEVDLRGSSGSAELFS